MDCAVEESEIRRALAPVTGVLGLTFQLSARTIKIDAPADVMPAALEAIRQAGFDPQPVGPEASEAHADAPVSEGLWRLGLALALAIAAELVEFFAPETLVFKGIGMGLAVVAIALAGVSIYRKGLASLPEPSRFRSAAMARASARMFSLCSSR